MDGSMIKQEIPESLVTDGIIPDSAGDDLTDSGPYCSGTNPEDAMELKPEGSMNNSVKPAMDDEIQNEKMGSGFIDPSLTMMSKLVVIAPQEDNIGECELYLTNRRQYSPDHQEDINQGITIPTSKQEIMDIVVKEEITQDIDDKPVRGEIQNCEENIKSEDDINCPWEDNLEETVKMEEQPADIKNEMSVDRHQEDLIKSESSAAGLDWTSSLRKTSEDGYSMVAEQCGSKITNNLVSRIRAQTDQILLELESTNNIDERDRDSATPCQEPETSVTTKRKRSGRKPHQCVECGRTFTKKSGLDTHLLTHSGEKPHECMQCGKFFSLPVSLKRHMLTHSGEKPHECKQCGKFFTLLETLRRHMLTHSGDKPYQCKQCGKFFTQSGHLRNHMKLHTKEKPFHCEQCGNEFARKDCLVKHMLTHSAKKPHECIECGKTFTQKQHLVYHMLTHSGIKPFQCPECGKTFTRRHDLVRHTLTHSDEKPHECMQCGKLFSQTGGLQKHMKIHAKK